MKLVFLSAEFYKDYADCSEIEQKPTPPLHLRGEEFAVLKTINAHAIEAKMAQFICTYKKAKRAPNVPRNKRLLTYSTLQYFEEYIPKDTE